MPWRLAETPIAVVIHGRSKERSDVATLLASPWNDEVREPSAHRQRLR